MPIPSLTKVHGPIRGPVINVSVCYPFISLVRLTLLTRNDEEVHETGPNSLDPDRVGGVLLLDSFPDDPGARATTDHPNLRLFRVPAAIRGLLG